MSKGRIFSYRRDRLGGRLRSIVNAMRLAEWTGRDMRVLWPTGRYAQELARPTEFFSANFVDRFLELDENLIESSYENAKHIGDFNTYQEALGHLNDGGDIVVENTKGPISLPSESQNQAELAFIETARRVEPSPEILNALSRFDETLADGSAIALHVRRGDIIQPGRWSRTYWPTKYVPDEYYDVMIEENPEALFLLFSDTAETLERFECVHGIKSAAKVLELDKLLESQRDFAELLAISRCEKIFASTDSAFSSAASTLGGVEKISLPEDMPRDLKIKAEQRLKSRVLKGPKAFQGIYDYGQCARRIMDLHPSSKVTEDIVQNVVENGWELPFVTRTYIYEAVMGDQDTAVLAVLNSEQNVRKLRRSHFNGSDLLKHTMRRSLLAGFALAGLGHATDAAQLFSNLALSQTKICPLDILSVELKNEFTEGRAGVPPTTLVPFFDGQEHPRGLSSTSVLNSHYQTRFLTRRAALNWQTAFDLDWRTIGVNDRPTPREPQLRQVIEVGKSSDDPMQVSLAALAMLRLNRLKRAKALMAKAERLGEPISALNKALLLKRRAQIAENAGNLEAAERALSQAMALTDHPAFVAYCSYYFTRRKNLLKAREVISSTLDRPFYVSWLNYELFAQRHQKCDNREEMRQEILDHFKIQKSWQSEVTKVA